MYISTKVVKGFQVVQNGQNLHATVMTEGEVTPPVLVAPLGMPAVRQYLSPQAEKEMLEQIQQVAATSGRTAALAVLEEKRKEFSVSPQFWHGTSGKATLVGMGAVGGVLVFLGGRWVYRKLTASSDVEM